jgi:3-oxoacyl-[acyl-carrier protein] reductase
MKFLENQVAVVTGAGRGIGAAIAVELAHLGASVALISRRPESAAGAAAAIPQTKEGQIRSYAVDVSQEKETEATMGQIIADFGHVDILVNNAGITRDNLMMRMSSEEWDAVLDTNLKGAFHCIKPLLRPMTKARYGRIINIASVSGLMGIAGQTNYAASKAGLIGLTKSLAREVASRSITANVIAPGFIETDMTSVLNEKVREAALGQIPLNKFGKTEDIAASVAFLASPAASYITGQVLAVDGGMSM